MAHMRCCTSPRRLSWLGSTLGPALRRNSSGGGGGEPVSSIEERGPYASRLKSRGVVRFEGPDTFRYLQGLVSNDLKRLEQESPPQSAVPTHNQPVALAQPLYAALLNPQGRFLFDLFLYRPVRPEDRLDERGSGPGSNGTPTLLCDADASTLDELLYHLRKHKLRAKVEFEDISKDFSIWQHYGGSLTQDSLDNEDPEIKNSGWGAASNPAALASIEGNNKGYCWFKDPRCRALGLRGAFPSDTIPPLVEADKEVDKVYYLLLRLELGIAEGCIEIPKEKANPLEYNLAWLNAISFEKGCYMGQELIARTHHRGVIRKRLMPIKFVNETGEEVQQMVVPGAEIIDRTTQKKVGDVTTVLGSRGLGVIRLEAAHKDAAQLVVKSLNGVHVKLHMPKWWPADWCPDELQQDVQRF